MYTQKELQWIQNFIDTRFSGVDASDEMIAIMEKSGLMKQVEKDEVAVIKAQKAALPKEIYDSGVLIEAYNLIS
jgi:hypothetical protein